MTTQTDALRAAREALNAVLAIANNSDVIAGWHQNGDIATWSELLPEVPTALAIVDAALSASQPTDEQIIEEARHWLDVDAIGWSNVIAYRRALLCAPATPTTKDKP
jgi:hypothetical protein